MRTTAIQPYVSQVRTSMDRVRNVKTKLTAIDTAADIRADVDSLRAEITTALEAIETLLRNSAATPSSSLVADVRRVPSAFIAWSENGH